MKIDQLIESVIDSIDQQNFGKKPLAEAVSSIVYHYTNFKNAAKIMKSGRFHLAISTGDRIEQSYQPKESDYFMSVTRTKLGSFHANGSKTSGVLFVLDGDWINRRNKGKAVEYFSGSRASGRSEAEDRIFSRTPTLPITPVVEMHLLLQKENGFMQPASDVRAVMLHAKKNNIPYYVYFDHDAWVLQDKRKALDSKEYLHLAKAEKTDKEHPMSYVQTRDASPFMMYSEIMNSVSYEKLSKPTKMIVNDFVRYPHYVGYNIENLERTIANARKPGGSDYDQATKFLVQMRSKYGTPSDFFKAMVTKWKALFKEYYDKKYGADD